MAAVGLHEFGNTTRRRVVPVQKGHEHAIRRNLPRLLAASCEEPFPLCDADAIGKPSRFKERPRKGEAGLAHAFRRRQYQRRDIHRTDILPTMVHWQRRAIDAAL